MRGRAGEWVVGGAGFEGIVEYGVGAVFGGDMCEIGGAGAGTGRGGGSGVGCGGRES